MIQFLLLLIYSQGPIATGPLGPLCLIDKGHIVPCYLIEKIPGKPPAVIIGPKPHNALVRRFTFQNSKHRVARDVKFAGKAAVVISTIPLP